MKKFSVRIGHLNPMECGRTIEVIASTSTKAYEIAEKEITPHEFIQGVYCYE